jgi:hypothetical protein
MRLQPLSLIPQIPIIYDAHGWNLGVAPLVLETMIDDVGGRDILTRANTWLLQTTMWLCPRLQN